MATERAFVGSGLTGVARLRHSSAWLACLDLSMSTTPTVVGAGTVASQGSAGKMDPTVSPELVA